MAESFSQPSTEVMLTLDMETMNDQMPANVDMSQTPHVEVSTHPTTAVGDSE